MIKYFDIHVDVCLSEYRKGATDRRLAHILIDYKGNRSVCESGAVTFVVYYYLYRMRIRHKSR